MLFTKIIGIYCYNHTKHINKMCAQDAGFLNIAADRIYILNNVFKGVNSNKLFFFWGGGRIMRPSECTSESRALLNLPQGRLKDIAVYLLYLHCKLIQR